MRSFLTILTFAVFIGCLQEVTAQKSFLYTDPLKAEVSMDQFNDPYAFKIKYLEAPHPSGKAAMRAFLRQRKLDAQKATPIRPSTAISSRGTIPPPEILASFTG